MKISFSKLFVYLDVMRIVLNFTSYIMYGKPEVSVNNYPRSQVNRKKIYNENVKAIYIWIASTLVQVIGGRAGDLRKGGWRGTPTPGTDVNDHKLSKQKYSKNNQMLSK